MVNDTGSGFLSIVPLTLISITTATVAYLLAREKGRRVAVWTTLGLIPFVNFICLWYFVGAANLRLESKLDRILASLDKGEMT